MKFVLAGEEGALKEVAVSEILMIKLTSKGPRFYTVNGEYSYAMTLSTLLSSLQAMGFESLDRNNIVNTEHIRHYDEVRREVLLGNGQQPEIRACVSVAGSKKLPDHMRESAAIYYISATA